MFIPLWALVLAAILFVLLIVSDIYLYLRVKRVEEIMRRLEGVNGSKWDDDSRTGGVEGK